MSPPSANSSSARARIAWTCSLPRWASKAPATRETRIVRTITLRAHGGNAGALYRHVNPENFDAKDCDRATARGYRVYAPNLTRAFYVANRHTACRIGRPDSVRPVVSGSHPG